MEHLRCPVCFEFGEIWQNKNCLHAVCEQCTTCLKCPLCRAPTCYGKSHILNAMRESLVFTSPKLPTAVLEGEVPVTWTPQLVSQFIQLIEVGHTKDLDVCALLSVACNVEFLIDGLCDRIAMTDSPALTCWATENLFPRVPQHVRMIFIRALLQCLPRRLTPLRDLIYSIPSLRKLFRPTLCELGSSGAVYCIQGAPCSTLGKVYKVPSLNFVSSALLEIPLDLWVLVEGIREILGTGKRLVGVGGWITLIFRNGKHKVQVVCRFDVACELLRYDRYGKCADSRTTHLLTKRGHIVNGELYFPKNIVIYNKHTQQISHVFST